MMHLTHPGMTQIRSPLVHFVKYQGGKQRQKNKKKTLKKKWLWTRRVSCQELIQSDPIVTVIGIQLGSDIEDKGEGSL